MPPTNTSSILNSNKDMIEMSPNNTRSTLNNNNKNSGECVPNGGGVTRGCGWQYATVYIDLATFYCMGMPVATVLDFTLKLHAKGLWIGLICGLLSQDSSLLLLILCWKWNRLQLNETTNTQNPV